MSSKIFIGNNPIADSFKDIAGEYVDLEGDRFYKISNYDGMRPFFISLVSHSDHWLFISSTGGLSAGRRNDESSLFPYYTDDKISESSESTGNKAIILVSREAGKQHMWEPFSERNAGVYRLQRNIYKNVSGNRLIFEEVNLDLQVTYSYRWEFSEKYGFIKRTSLKNSGDQLAKINLVDGLQNIMPNGVNSGLQGIRSNLANAYKRSELADERGLGVFALSSMIVDRAEPSEALKASTAWSVGLPANGYLLCSLQLDDFRRTGAVRPEHDVKAEVGAFFVHSEFDMNPNSSLDWIIGAEVNQDYADVVALQQKLADPQALKSQVENTIAAGTDALRKKVALADGQQLTADELSTGRHFSNVLFNIMRGGLFEDQYLIYTDDLKAYAQMINKYVFASNASFFNGLPANIKLDDLTERAQAAGDVDLTRICREYLPLTFSRRHGDPSRPWNRFSIELKNEDGSVNRHYEGNWRDIFQNWEALAYSIPGFTNSIIAKFVNASTVDGYNPYRISRDGIDWEVIEPDDPWSYIGYWGDHQIIYLQKLLELSVQHFPDRIYGMLSEESFVYANVPYRIKSYKEIVADPQDTIIFDEGMEERVQHKVAEVGADGKLIFGGSQLVHANLTEKLLVMVLAKLSNFIPEAGIWLNTQRPEWNDANNALVGNGVSMVTLYYLRRNIAFLKQLFSEVEESAFNVHAPVNELFKSMHGSFERYQDQIEKGFSDQVRKSIVDELGIAGEAYRNKMYGGQSEKEGLDKAALIAFFELSLKYIDQSIRINKRNDGLYHAYNLITFQGDALKVDHLYEMLEGQVSALSAGTFTLKESLNVLDALKASDIYREDQYSYMLYPNRELPKFLERNIIPSDFVSRSPLAQQLLADGNKSLLSADAKGAYHFNGSFNNNNNLKACLERLKKSGYAELVEKEYDDYLTVFEKMFDHKSFTGRSGTFFGYEGLGSIYWHMVSKLLVAVQECIWNASEEEKASPEMYQMIDHYYEIRAGIGINKSPELYGSFPTDPYSHTPMNKGAQQPGMTGQVKEDILNRWAELGVRVDEGKISFQPFFLNPEEYLNTSQSFEYFDVAGSKQTIKLAPGQLAFTYCQVPVVYSKGDKAGLSWQLSDGTTINSDASHTVDEKSSAKLFNRTGEIVRVDVQVGG
ncbi:MAG: hypothetical protein RIC80_22205 [Cyclobacteriaceae bacterium]